MKTFKRGDKISISPFSGDSGIVIGMEGDKVVWESELGGIYKTPVKDYNIVLKNKNIEHERHNES